MADFTELKVDGTGKNLEVCGPYHMNRHRIYFNKPSTPRLYGNLLYSGFSRFLDQDAAKVEKRSRTFDGKPTFAFTGSPPLPVLKKYTQTNPHEDWVYVAQKDISRGFTGQTLKRNYLELKEMAGLVPAAGLSKVEEIIDSIEEYFGAEKDGNDVEAAAMWALKVNQHHFLAGRRSWVIAPASEFDHDVTPVDPNLMVFETAAIERASLPIYAKFRPLFDEQTKIIWATLLRQYVSKNGFKVVDHRPWTGRNVAHKNNVSFIYNETATKGDMEKLTNQMCKIHKHLWP